MFFLPCFFLVFLEVDGCSLLFSIPLEVSPQFGKKTYGRKIHHESRSSLGFSSPWIYHNYNILVRVVAGGVFHLGILNWGIDYLSGYRWPV